MRFRLVLILLAVLAPAALMALDPPPAAGVPQPILRAPRSAELAGVWQMVGLTRSPQVDADDSLFAPYQVFFFDPGGGMKHMTSAKPFTEHSLALFDSAPLVTRYAVDRKGVLNLTNPAWDVPRKYQCGIVLNAVPDPKGPRPGDLVLSGLDEAGKVVWAKVLRKLP